MGLFLLVQMVWMMFASSGPRKASSCLPSMLYWFRGRLSVGVFGSPDLPCGLVGFYCFLNVPTIADSKHYKLYHH